MMKNLIEKVNDIANEVYTTLGDGYPESVYEEAMGVEMRLQGISYEMEKNTEVFYKKEKVGTHRLDFVVEDNLVLELKSATSISKSHIAQLSSYLNTLGLKKGIIINFPYPMKEEAIWEVVDLDSK